MVGAVDVHYPADGGARAALVLADDPTYARIVGERVEWLDTVAAYQPGSFYTRELPAIQAVLAGAPPLRLLVVDGYCDLDPAGRPGLGRHVHQAIGIPVIGVAKTSFHTASHAAAVRRGAATKPLFVTACGLTIAEAARIVTSMAGPYRLPDALRRADALARRGTIPAP
ncbi:MAG: endonuclease V [Micromonosporaceae bacterium]|nr:endonuclease V [Micromonosporaceae bacterium]